MIEVRTVKNGYALKFDGMKQPQGFLYFTPEKLLEGFMLHIGMEMLDTLDTETMQDFIVAACQWNENSKCVKEIERLTHALEMMTHKRNSLANQLIKERRRYNLLLDEVNGIVHCLNMPEVKKAFTTIGKSYKHMKDLTLAHLGVDSKFIVEREDSDEDEDDEP